MIQVPPSLEWMDRLPRARAWRDGAAAAFTAQLERWSLTLDGPAYDGGYASLVAPVRTSDGGAAVLKLQFPHPECVHEATALRRWNGRGAVRLLDHDDEHHALLVERCVPGTPLADVEEHEALLDAAVELLPRVLVPIESDDPFDRLADVARGWLDDLPTTWQRLGRPFPQALLDRVVATGRELADTCAHDHLVQQDLHSRNVLRAEREPWLVIDPKPLTGERELAAVALVRDDELGLTRDLVLRRLDRLAADLRLDRTRVRDWTVLQTLSWDIDTPNLGRALGVVDWLLDA